MNSLRSVPASVNFDIAELDINRNCVALETLGIGSSLEMVIEEKRAASSKIGLYCSGFRIGSVPEAHSTQIARMCELGCHNSCWIRICGIDLDNPRDHQISVSVIRKTVC